MGKGQGKGYKNMMGADSKVHSLSAKGLKQPQRINPMILQPQNNTTEIVYDEKDIVVDEEMTVGEQPKMGFGSKLKKGFKKGYEATKNRIADEKAKAKERRFQARKDELHELKRPEVRKLETQEKRVDELRFQKESEEDPEEIRRLEKELDKEEHQLNERIEEVTNINLEDYSDKELKKLAIRHKPNESIFADIFGSGENRYKKELLRRTTEGVQLNKDLVEARKPKKKEEGFFDL